MYGSVIAVGYENNLLLFKSVGVDVCIFNNLSEAEKWFNDLSQNYSVIFITDKLSKQLRGTINMFKDLIYPIIVPIGLTKETSNAGLEGIVSQMKDSLGINFLKGE